MTSHKLRFRKSINITLVGVYKISMKSSKEILGCKQNSFLEWFVNCYFLINSFIYLGVHVYGGQGTPFRSQLFFLSPMWLLGSKFRLSDFVEDNFIFWAIVFFLWLLILWVYASSSKLNDVHKTMCIFITIKIYLWPFSFGMKA